MLFLNGVFSTDLLPNDRVRAVLAAAVERATIPIRTLDIIVAAVRNNDFIVVETIAQCLPQSADFDAFYGSISTRIELPRPLNVPYTRADFAPNLLHSLDEFVAVLTGSGGVLNSVALELLLHFVLAHLDESDRHEMSPLDAIMASVRFRDKVAQMIHPQSTGFQRPSPLSSSPDQSDSFDKPFVLPPQLLPSEDLTQRVRQSEPLAAAPFDGEPVFDTLFKALARGLHRSQVRHVLLVGERGVGKTTVVAELARRATTGQIVFLAKKRFLSVDSRYVPSDESRPRLTAMLAHVSNRADLIVCVDGLAGLLRGEHGASHKPVLLSALTHARCQLIGLLTPREYEDLVADDPDFADFFNRVDVEEPDAELSLRLTRHFAAGLEHRFRVAIETEAVRQAVALSADYILNDQLPSKAVKLLYRACEEIDFERTQQGNGRNCVTGDDVVRIFAQVSGMPEETLRGVAGQLDYEQSLKDVIFGQDHAVREVATELGLIKAGMTDPNKPASVLLFLGQTGTGKTEMAKALARFYSTSKRLKTYTLGNCVEPHSVATIIGVPPGYVGHDQGGRLINDLNTDPYCVFLLDEADKAHPDVLQPFLNLFDEGWVSDQRGTRAYGNKSIFILTSNVGQRMIAEMVQQQKSLEEITTRMKEALSQIRHTKSDRPVFTPEFLARIKRIIVFHSLTREAMAGISRKLMEDLRESWAAKRGKRFEFPESLVEYVSEEAHKRNERSAGKEGGRIVRKLLSEWVEAPLQRAVSRQPDEYRRCNLVSLTFKPAVETEPSPTVAVEFR